MGDKAHIKLVSGYDEDPTKAVYVYSHWSGTELPQMAAVAIEAARSRWGDVAYANRMIIASLHEQTGGLDAFGIDAEWGDTSEGHRTVEINHRQQTVTLTRNGCDPIGPVSFEDYVKSRPAWPFGRETRY